MSRTLATGKETAKVIHGTSFTPHSPVEMRLDLSARARSVTALPRPKPLPIERPIGPVFPGARVQWRDWELRRSVDGGAADFASAQNLLVSQWYAGVEAEITTATGIFGGEDECAYLGLGREGKPKTQPQKGRYRNVGNDEGLIGVRMSWATNAVRTVARYARILIENWVYRAQAASSQIDEGRVTRIVNLIRRVAHRASALVRAPRSGNDGADADWDCVLRGLKALAAAVKRRHRQSPLVEQWKNGGGYAQLVSLESVATEIEARWHQCQKGKRSKQLKEVKQWAKEAPASVAHNATKLKSGAVPITASATKAHRGEACCQDAADKGVLEWANHWKS